MLQQKNQKRALTILWNGLRQAIVPFLGLLFSWIITKKFSVGLWGGVTQIVLLVSIITHISSWGNSEYLLREFSANPGNLKVSWQKCLIDRLPILFIACLGIGIYFSNALGIVIVLWCIVEYAYQGYEPIINFQKKYFINVAAELVATTILFIGIFIFRSNLSLPILITLLMLSDICKTLVVIFYFFKNLTGFKLQLPDLNYYATAFSFFLLGLVGLLYARADLIYVTVYLSKPEIAFYQIATTLFSFSKVGAGFLILPFVPVLYRLKKHKIHSLSLKFTLAGCLLSILSFIVIYFILTLGYKFNVSLVFLLWGFLTVIPAYYTYALIIFLFKVNKQSKVVIYGFVGIVVDLLLSFLLVPSFGTLGAIAAAAIAQWIVIPFYLYEMSTVKPGFIHV